MNGYLTTLLDTSVPIVLACACGALLAWKHEVKTSTLTDLSLYVLAPSLVLIALGESRIPVSIFTDIALFTAVQTVASLFVGWAAGRLMALDPAKRAALSLTTIFSNSNNYGLPVLLLAFGAAGFSLGAAYVIGQVILVNTLGLFLAARSSFRPGEAMKRILRVPLIYACAAGILLYITRIELPKGLNGGLKLLGNAYPAVVLVILGVQIRKMKWEGFKRIEVWVAVVLRMVVIPLISLAVLSVLGFHGLLARVLLVETAMPAAINGVVLAEKYGADTELVAFTVSVTTLISFVSLPVWISLS
ncbi:MAG TPA: AEC family transporter [Spirochaetia bacterium]|nr:AEC family transporter [Spirochaetia bacterium]